MPGILQSSNVWFESTGATRIGYDGTVLNIPTDITLNAIPNFSTFALSAFLQANTAYAQANGARTTANLGYITSTITTTYTTPGTYTHVPNSKMVFAQVIATGGGGASGGAEATSLTTLIPGGGGGGGTCISYVTAARFGANATIVVGQGGTANSRSPRAGAGLSTTVGNSGGASTVTFSGLANTMIAGGGGGAIASEKALGTGPFSVNVQDSGPGGTATGGDINISGANGDFSTFALGGTTDDRYGGFGLGGGASYWAQGARGNVLGFAATARAANAIPTATLSYGAGAGSGVSANNASAYNAAGANGIVVIEEFISS